MNSFSSLLATPRFPIAPPATHPALHFPASDLSHASKHILYSPTTHLSRRNPDRRPLRRNRRSAAENPSSPSLLTQIQQVHPHHRGPHLRSPSWLLACHWPSRPTLVTTPHCRHRVCLTIPGQSRQTTRVGRLRTTSRTPRRLQRPISSRLGSLPTMARRRTRHRARDSLDKPQAQRQVQPLVGHLVKGLAKRLVQDPNLRPVRLIVVLLMSALPGLLTTWSCTTCLSWRTGT